MQEPGPDRLREFEGYGHSLNPPGGSHDRHDGHSSRDGPTVARHAGRPRQSICPSGAVSKNGSPGPDRQCWAIVTRVCPAVSRRDPGNGRVETCRGRGRVRTGAKSSQQGDKTRSAVVVGNGGVVASGARDRGSASRAKKASCQPARGSEPATRGRSPRWGQTHHLRGLALAEERKVPRLSAGKMEAEKPGSSGAKECEACPGCPAILHAMSLQRRISGSGCPPHVTSTRTGCLRSLGDKAPGTWDEWTDAIHAHSPVNVQGQRSSSTENTQGLRD